MTAESARDGGEEEARATSAEIRGELCFGKMGAALLGCGGWVGTGCHPDTPMDGCSQLRGQQQGQGEGQSCP